MIERRLWPLAALVLAITATAWLSNENWATVASTAVVLGLLWAPVTGKLAWPSAGTSRRAGIAVEEATADSGEAASSPAGEAEGRASALPPPPRIRMYAPSYAPAALRASRLRLWLLGALALLGLLVVIASPFAVSTFSVVEPLATPSPPPPPTPTPLSSPSFAPSPTPLPSGTSPATQTPRPSATPTATPAPTYAPRQDEFVHVEVALTYPATGSSWTVDEVILMTREVANSSEAILAEGQPGSTPWWALEETFAKMGWTVEHLSDGLRLIWQDHVPTPPLGFMDRGVQQKIRVTTPDFPRLLLLFDESSFACVSAPTGVIVSKAHPLPPGARGCPDENALWLPLRSESLATKTNQANVPILLAGPFWQHPLTAAMPHLLDLVVGTAGSTVLALVVGTGSKQLWANVLSKLWTSIKERFRSRRPSDRAHGKVRD